MFVIKEGPFNLFWTHILDWFRWGQESCTQFLWRKARCWGIAAIFWQENGKSNPTVQEGWIWAELNKSLCVHTSFRCFALHRELSTSSVFRCSALHWCHSVLMYIFHIHIIASTVLCPTPKASAAFQGRCLNHFQVSSLLWGCEIVLSALLVVSESNPAREPVVQCGVLPVGENGPHTCPAAALSMPASWGWRRRHAAAGASLTAKLGDRAGGAVPPSRKLYFVLSGMGFSRFFFFFFLVLCQCTWTSRVTPSWGKCRGRTHGQVGKTSRRREVCFSLKLVGGGEGS